MLPIIPIIIQAAIQIIETERKISPSLDDEVPNFKTRYIPTIVAIDSKVCLICSGPNR